MVIEETVVPLFRYAGHRRSVGLLVLGNVPVIGVAALVHQLLATTGASVAQRATASIVAGALVLAVVLLVLRGMARVVAAELVVRDGIVRIVERRRSSTPCSIHQLEVRRLAYLAHEGSLLAPHVMTLEIRGLADRPLRICAPGVLGGWEPADGRLDAAPEYEVRPAHWPVLTSVLLPQIPDPCEL